MYAAGNAEQRLPYHTRTQLQMMPQNRWGTPLLQQLAGGAAVPLLFLVSSILTFLPETLNMINSRRHGHRRNDSSYARTTKCVLYSTLNFFFEHSELLVHDLTHLRREGWYRPLEVQALSSSRISAGRDHASNASGSIALLADPRSL